MSRHRHIRNLRYDDYDDGLDDALSSSSSADSDTAAYYTRPSQPPAPPPAPAADASLLNDLAAQFRLCLNDDTLQESAIDAAIVAADYDVDAALALLRAQRAADMDAAAAALANLELTDPSPIALMLADHPTPPPVPPLPDAPHPPAHPTVHLHTGPALLPPATPPSPVVPFAFDKPSPDDLVRARQAGATDRKKTVLRMPKPSTLRSGAPRPRRSNPPANPNAPASAASSSPAPPPAAASVPPPVNRDPPKRPDPRPPSAVPSAKVKQRAKRIDLSARRRAGCSSVSVVVAGHVDAGKSTLLGHMLRLLEARVIAEGKGKRRRALEDLAWATDEDAVERERGVTIDIATRVFKTEGENGRTYAMIDAPGHRDFVPAMIVGATQASASLLVVDASPGEFEAGFSENGQTREHALVLKSLGVSRLIVIVNKMDVVDFGEQRYEEVVKMMKEFLRGNGWKVDKGVSFVAASGREGVNLVTQPDTEHPLMQWYKGQTVLEAIEALPGTNQSLIAEVSAQPTRLIVSDFFRCASLGGNAAVTGRLLCGSIAPKDKLAICPGGSLATVKNLEWGTGERNGVAVAGADSLPISIGLMDLTDGLNIASGSVLCDPEEPVPVVVQFKAQIITVTTGTPLIPGTRAVLHIGGGAEAAAITKLCEYVVNKKPARAQKVRRPRRLIKGERAVVEITCDRAVAMEKCTDVKALSRFALRQNGQTVAVGVVTEVIKTSQDVAADDANEVRQGAAS